METRRRVMVLLPIPNPCTIVGKKLLKPYEDVINMFMKTKICRLISKALL